MDRSITLFLVSVFSSIVLIVSIDGSKAKENFTPLNHNVRAVNHLSACLVGCSRIPLQICEFPPDLCDQPRFECEQACRDGFNTSQDDGI